MAKHKTREDWLASAVAELTKLFKRHGFSVPKGIKATCGWPGGGSIHKRIGECWPVEASAGKFHELFISPRLDEVGGECGVLPTLVHEMAHAVVGCKHGHKAPFKQCAVELGLTGKMTATAAGPELQDELAQIAKKLGTYPHKRLVPTKHMSKQTTRLLKVACPGCGYVARVTRTHLDEKGPPICPLCEIQFEEAA